MHSHNKIKQEFYFKRVRNMRPLTLLVVLNENNTDIFRAFHLSSVATSIILTN